MTIGQEPKPTDSLLLSNEDVSELLELVDQAAADEIHLRFRGFALSVRKKLAAEAASPTESTS